MRFRRVLTAAEIKNRPEVSATNFGAVGSELVC
nr:MAG TPA: hypothetical protein [Caudoviricetes sp.]